MDTDGRELENSVGHLRPGFALASGRYRIERFLGVWGIRALYAATELPSERSAMIAELALTTTTAVERRAVQLMHLEHPALPVLREFFPHRGFLYLVFNLADGSPLDQVLASRPSEAITERQALNWGIQLADGLAFLHRQQPPIVVADLAPSAIFLTPYDRVKLVSLGVGLGLYTPAELVGALEQGYAAPEVYMGRLDALGDIYALGALLHRVLSGGNPASHAPGSLPPLRTLRPDVTPELAAAIARALTLVPEGRWPNAASFAEALRGAEVALLAGAAAQAEAARAPMPAAPAEAERVQPDESEVDTLPRMRGVVPGATHGTPPAQAETELYQERSSVLAEPLGAPSPAPETESAATPPAPEPETPSQAAPAPSVAPAAPLDEGMSGAAPMPIPPADAPAASPPAPAREPGAASTPRGPEASASVSGAPASAAPAEGTPFGAVAAPGASETAGGTGDAPPAPPPPAPLAPPAPRTGQMYPPAPSAPAPYAPPPQAPSAASMPPGGLYPQPAPGSQPAPLRMPPVVAPLPASRKPGLFGGLFGGRFGGNATSKSPRPVDATGTVMLARRMQEGRQYAAVVRIVGKPEEEVRAISFATGAQMGKTGLGKLTSGTRATVEVAALPPEAFHLPQPRVTLLVPKPGSLSEVRIPIVARRPSYAGGSDRLYFTFRGPDGRQLHADPFVAEVSILARGATDVPVPTSDMLTLVHTINVLV